MAFSKKLFSILAIPLFALLLSLIYTKPVNAAEFHFNDYDLAQDQTLNDDLYVTSTNTNINGFVNGDLFVVAEKATISGTVSGDVYIVAQTASFTGNAYGNVYIIGDNINVEGNVKGNLDVIGNTVVSTAQIEKDFNNISANLNLRGAVGDDARLIGSNIYTQNTVGGDLITLSSKADTTGSTVRGKSYTYTDIKAIAKEQGVDWDAKISDAKAQTQETKLTNRIWGLLYSFVSMGLVGYLMIMLMPVKTGKIIAKITGTPKDLIFSFLVGLLVLTLAPAGLVLLSISIVGFPLAMVIFGVLFFVSFFGRLWTEVAFGQELLTLCKVNGYRPFKSLAVGRLISVVISLIPVIGFIYTFVLMCISTGATLRLKNDYLRAGKK